MRRHTKPDTRLSLASSGCPIVRADDAFGFYQSAGTEETLRAWRARGRHRPEFYARDACAMTAMAGVIAERIILGHDCGGHWADVADIYRLLPDDPGDRRKTRLAAAVWLLVRRHRSRIEFLSIMLRACGTLEGWEIDRVYVVGSPASDNYRLSRATE
jgi:hypothetical protein